MGTNLDNKYKIEAVLFAVGKEISTKRLASLCELKETEIDKIMEELVNDYNSQNNSLKVIRREDNWKLTVKDEYINLVNNLVTETDLDKPLMETLAVIAWKYPVVQSEIIKLRHSKAYDHIKQLLEMGFVQKIRSGRTYKLKLTKKFFEYFDLPSAEAKNDFLKHIPKEVLQDAEETEKEADEVELLIEKEDKDNQSRDEIKGAMAQVKSVGKVGKSLDAKETTKKELADKKQTTLETNSSKQEGFANKKTTKNETALEVEDNPAEEEQIVPLTNMVQPVESERELEGDEDEAKEEDIEWVLAADEEEPVDEKTAESGDTQTVPVTNMQPPEISEELEEGSEEEIEPDAEMDEEDSEEESSEEELSTGKKKKKEKEMISQVFD